MLGLMKTLYLKVEQGRHKMRIMINNITSTTDGRGMFFGKENK